MTEPILSDEQRKAIEARIDEAWELDGGFSVLYGAAEQVVNEDLPELLEAVAGAQARIAELEALVAERGEERADLRKIVAHLADIPKRPHEDASLEILRIQAGLLMELYAIDAIDLIAEARARNWPIGDMGGRD